MTRLNGPKSVLAVLAFLSFLIGGIGAEHVSDDIFNLMAEGIEPEDKEFFKTQEIERQSELNDVTGTVLYGDYADEEASDKHRMLKSTPVVGAERLCFDYNTVDGICTVSDKHLRFEENFIYVTDKQLVFNNTKMYCLTVSHHPCDFGFNLTSPESKFEMRGKSSIAGRQVILEVLEGKVILDDDAHFNVTGLSMNTNGTMSHGAGASFIGSGGECGKTEYHDKAFNGEFYKSYGEFDMAPSWHHVLRHQSQIGSMGLKNNTETNGGGRVLIKADSVMFKTAGYKIRADGFPLADQPPPPNGTNLPGGTGGYVAIMTTNNNAANQLHERARISAVGGTGYGSGVGGGSGGVIILLGGFELDESDVDASGGTAPHPAEMAPREIGCANGAAGTVWMKSEDLLLVDNKNKPTNKMTRIQAPHASQEKGKPHLIAKKVHIQGRANAEILGERNFMAFDDLKMSSKSELKLKRTRANFSIHMRRDIALASDSLLDFSMVMGIILNSTDTNTRLDIGNVVYKRGFGIHGKMVKLNGLVKIHRPKKANMIFAQYERKSRIMMKIDQDLELGGKAYIESGHILLQANGTINSEAGFGMKSFINSTCNMDQHGKDLFTCIPHKTLNPVFTHDSYIKSFNDQFNYIKISNGTHNHATTLDQVISTVFGNYTIYVVSFKEINLIGSDITAPRIGMCAPDININSNTKLQTSGLGCPSAHGLGGGYRGAFCGGTGGAHGGVGGYGMVNSPAKHKQATCTKHWPKPYFYGKEARYEGSGGGSGVHGKLLGGAGGGIIWLSSTGTLTINRSSIKADGTEGTTDTKKYSYGSGGGAGGSIQIITTNLRGNGWLSVTGGNGSNRGGGGGAGGRVVVDMLKSFYQSSYPAQSLYWWGTLDIKGGLGGLVDASRTSSTSIKGANGQDGTVFHSKCHGGYSGPFCNACNVGEFKLGFGYGVCKPCENKPDYAYYSHRGVYISECPYQCSSGLDPVEINPYCEDAFNSAIHRVGGAKDGLLIVSGFIILLILIWISLISRSNQILEKIGDANSKVYDGVLFNGAEKDFNIKEASRGNLGMQDSDIWSHSHRMYLIGENSINFPWFIAKDFPLHALEPLDKDKFLYFLKHKQAMFDWDEAERSAYLWMQILYLPGAAWLHHKFRLRHFNTLRNNLYEQFDEKFFSKSNKTMRLSLADGNGHLAYIDFLDKSKSKLDFNGNKLPVNLMLSGCGTFNSPYYLNFEKDPYAKALVYLREEKMKKDLPIWFNNLNALLGKLSFYKLGVQTMKDLTDVIQWIEVGNKTLFNPENTKATLYLFENSYQEVEGGSFKQKRRSLPLDEKIWASFGWEMGHDLIRFVQAKLMVKKSEIRLGVLFREHTRDDEQKLRDRIRKVINQQMQLTTMSNKKNVNIDPSPLFLSDDEDEQERVTKETSTSFASAQNTLGAIRHNKADEEEGKQEDDEVLDEANMSETKVYVHGEKETHMEYVKIIDNSRRAFETSLASTRAFTKSLRKPRSSCGDRCIRFRATVYAFWILFFKHHGKAPGEKGLYSIFLAFSVLIAFDIMLLMSMLGHIFGPVSNFQSIGVTFLLTYPLITIMAPICGTLGCILGSPDLLKSQSSMNAAAVLLNYPATLAVMLYKQDEAVYIACVIVLWFNKIALSFVGAKVRQHLINPGFVKNESKFRDMAERQDNSMNQFPRDRYLTKVNHEEEGDELKPLSVNLLDQSADALDKNNEISDLAAANNAFGSAPLNISAEEPLVEDNGVFN